MTEAHEVPINYRDDGDNPRVSVLDRFIARMTRKPASWCPGGWYDIDAPKCRVCEFSFGKPHKCQSICSCSCLAQRLRRVHAMFEAEKAIEQAKRARVRVEHVDDEPIHDPDLVHFGVDLSHLYYPFPNGR